MSTNPFLAKYSRTAELCRPVYDEAIRIWNVVQRAHPFTLPADLTLGLLGFAYAASQASNEKREIRCSLLCGPRAEVDKSPQVSHLYAPLPLARPQTLDVELVRTMAHATHPLETFICVDTSSPLPQVWGLARLTLMPNHSRPLSLPEHVIIRIVAKNHFRLFLGDTFLGGMMGTDPYAPHPGILEMKGPVHDALRTAALALAAESKSAVRVAHRGELDPRRYIRFFDRLIRDIRSLAHAGILLWVPESQMDAVLPTLSPVRTLEGANSIWEHLKHEGMEDWELQAQEFRYPHYPKPAYQAELFSRFVAGLADVDGAVVLSDRLTVRGFGAIINATEFPPTILEAVKSCSGDDAVVRDFSTRGSRHQACFRFAWAHPGTMVFAFSEDGGIRAITRVDERLLTWPQVVSSMMWP